MTRTSDLRFRVTAEEKQAIQQQAAAAGLDVSDFLRRAVRDLPRHFRIRPQPMPTETWRTSAAPLRTDGVYLNRHGAWLGEVYEARDAHLKRTIAIMVMPHLHRDADDSNALTYVPAPANWWELVLAELPGEL